MSALLDVYKRQLYYGLQRLTYNGKPTFEMLKVEARSNGVEITFSEPLHGFDGWKKDDFEVKQWYYLPTENYGGPKMDLKRLEIVSSTLSDDKTKVFLELKGMKTKHVVYIHSVSYTHLDVYKRQVNTCQCVDTKKSECG